MPQAATAVTSMTELRHSAQHYMYVVFSRFKGQCMTEVSKSLQGKPYDRETLLEDSEAEDEEMQFDLGRFCAEKADFHHSLRRELHWLPFMTSVTVCRMTDWFS